MSADMSADMTAANPATKNVRGSDGGNDAENVHAFLADVNLRLRSLYAIGRPSVCRLSSVTLVHPTQPVEVFGNFFSPYDSSGTLVF